MAGRLEGKVAVITGGASGMALGAVEMYLAEGAKVVIADIKPKGPELEARFGENVRFSHADICNGEDIARTVAMAEAEFGGLDIMCHAAARSNFTDSLADITDDSWDQGQANLLRSHVMCIKHAIPAMKKRGGGSIILFSSASTNNFSPASPFTYVVCKGAVLVLGRKAAFDLAKDRIRVNVIVPGMFTTALWGDLVGASPEVAELMPPYLDEMASQWQPLPRYGRPSDIAYAATYLGSEESGFVTGTALPVDGGLSLYRPSMPTDVVMGHLENAKAMAEADLAKQTPIGGVHR